MKTYEEIFEDNTEETLVNEIDEFKNPELAQSKLKSMLIQLKKDQDEWFSKHGGKELFKKLG